MGDGGGRASRGYGDLEWQPASPGHEPSGRGSPALPAGGLLDVLLDADPDRCSRTLRRVVGRDPDGFVDDVLPETARLLGEMWLEDRVGFVEVTLATARLQAVLRDVDPGIEAGDAPLVAVVVPEGETHTLGATVAAWRLRRAGASVMMLLGRPEEEVATSLGGGDLSVVCLSSSSDRVASVALLVRRLRAASGAPVLLGGPILVGRDPEMLRQASGADAVSPEPEAALRLARGRRP